MVVKDVCASIVLALRKLRLRGFVLIMFDMILSKVLNKLLKKQHCKLNVLLYMMHIMKMTTDSKE